MPGPTGPFGGVPGGGGGTGGLGGGWVNPAIGRSTIAAMVRMDFVFIVLVRAGLVPSRSGSIDFIVLKLE